MARLARRRPNGDGSITKRADGRWMGRYYAWTTAGTRKRVTVYGRTRQEAADRMREAQEHNRQGYPYPTGPGSSATGSTIGWLTSSRRTGGPPLTCCMSTPFGSTSSPRSAPRR